MSSTFKKQYFNSISNNSKTKSLLQLLNNSSINLSTIISHLNRQHSAHLLFKQVTIISTPPAIISQHQVGKRLTSLLKTALKPLHSNNSNKLWPIYSNSKIIHSLPSKARPRPKMLQFNNHSSRPINKSSSNSSNNSLTRRVAAAVA